VFVCFLLTTQVYSQGINWRINGNNNIGEDHFIGSTDSSDFIIRTNNTDRIRVRANGATIIYDSLRILGPLLLGENTLEFSNNVNISGYGTTDRISSNSNSINFTGRVYTINPPPNDVLYHSGIKIGIGTQSPAHQLHLHSGMGQDNPQPSYTAYTNTNIGSSSTNGFLTGIETDGTAIINQQEDKNLSFFTGSGANNALRMTIIGTSTNRGFIGIGTASPRRELDLRGNLLINSDNSTGLQSQLTVRQTTNPISGSSVVLNSLAADFRQHNTSNGQASGIKFTIGNANSYTGTAAIIAERTGGWSQGKLHFAVNDSGSSGKTSIPIFMTIDGPSGGFVGIGTTNPQAKLDVQGDIIGENIYGEKAVFDTIETDIVSINKLLVNDNLGIGTQLPMRNLHFSEEVDEPVRKRSINTIVDIDSLFIELPVATRDSIAVNNEAFGGVRLSATYNSDFSNWDIQPTVSTYSGIYDNMPTSLNFESAVTQNTVLTLQDNGAVGIGTVSPESRLHVNNGNLSITNGVFNLENALQISVSNECLLPSGTVWALLEAKAPSNCSGGHKFLTKEGSNPSLIRMTILGNGFIGIGTEEPTAQLHTTGTVRFENFSDGLLAVDENGDIFVNNNINNVWSVNNDHIYNNNSSNVGVGTDYPSYKLDIRGGNLHVNNQLLFGNPSANNNLIHGEYKPMIFSSSSSGSSFFPGSSWLVLQSGSSDSQTRGIIFATCAGNDQVAERMRIDGEGKIGIGTASPQALLHLSANSFSDNFLLLENNSVAIFEVSDIGKVRVRDDLEVEGVIRSAEEVVVETFTWADFVFESTYKLQPFSERMQLIKTQKHLPNIRPESEILENGVPISETLKGLLQNVEEMYLYMDEMQTTMTELNEKLRQLEAENKALKAKIEGK
jgi:hypothetical protein